MAHNLNPAPIPPLPAEVGKVTPSQQKALDHLWSWLVPMSSLISAFPDKYEVKTWTVERYQREGSELPPSRWLSVTIEVGAKGDEGTLAQSLCRDHFHVFVSINGTLSVYRDSKAPEWLKRSKYAMTRQVIRRYGYIPRTR